MIGGDLSSYGTIWKKYLTIHTHKSLIFNLMSQLTKSGDRKKGKEIRGKKVRCGLRFWPTDDTDCTDFAWWVERLVK